MSTNLREILLTEEAIEKLKQEQNHLVQVERKKVIQNIKAARGQGDLSENADYDAARDRQAEIESRIKEIDFLLDRAKVVKRKKDHITVGVGKKVTILNLKTNKEATYLILGSLEADPYKNIISNTSPVAQSLMGKKVGSIVTVRKVQKPFEIKVLKID